MSYQKPHSISTHLIKANPEIVWKFLTEETLLNLWWCNSEKLVYKCSTDLRLFGIFRTNVEHKEKITVNRYQYPRHFPTSLGTAVQILPEKAHCCSYGV